MLVTIVTVGTRGDVQPYLALGRAFQRRGLAVRVATFEEFRGPVEDAGLTFAPIEGDLTARLRSNAGLAWLESGRNPVAYFRRMRAVVGPMMERAFETSLAACAGADLVIGSFLGARAAERLGIPAVFTSLWPLARTHAFPSPLMTLPALLRRVGPLNALSHSLVERLAEHRRPAGGPGLLARLEARRALHLYPCSQVLISRPADWAPWHQATGFWYLDRATAWRPPPALADFVASGPPPVYVGFGSMPVREPERVRSVVVDALARSRQRGILLDWGSGTSPGPLGDDAFVVNAVPHDWLFRRVTAVVHHGGGGTVGAALLAGVPSVCVPFFGDHHFWSWRVAATGVGPRPLPFARLEAGALAARIMAAVTDTSVRSRASAAAATVKREEGVARAIALVERRLETTTGVREG